MDGEREGEKHGLVASCTPQLRTYPTTQACTLTGSGTGDFLVFGMPLTPLSHTNHSLIYFILFLEGKNYGGR